MTTERRNIVKKSLLLYSMIFVLVLLDCGGRDLSTPSRRLVGHWTGLSKTTKEDVEIEQQLLDMLGDTSKPNLKEGIYEYHHYYGKPDAETQVGSYTHVGETGTIAQHKYRVISENPSEDWIFVKLLFSTGESREKTYVIGKDGMTFISETVFDAEWGMPEITSIDTLTYVDNNMSP